jgi:hypothetical protein
MAKPPAPPAPPPPRARAMEQPQIAPPAPPPTAGEPPAAPPPPDETTKLTPTPSEPGQPVLLAGANQFYPWAISASANVMPISTYASSGGLANGVSTGIADPTIINRAIRQATFIAAGLAQFVANQNYAVNDDGNLTNFVTNLTNALRVAVTVPPFASNAVALAGTDTASMISPASLNYVIGQKCLLLTGGSITGNLTITGTLTVNGASTLKGLITGNAGLTISSGAFTLPASSINATALAAGGASAGISNGQMLYMPAGTVKANLSGAPGPPTDATVAALQAALSALTSGGGGTTGQAHYSGQSTSGTASTENIPASTWTQRLLNTADPDNNITGASLAGNQATLPAGRYVVAAHTSLQATAGGAGWRATARLRDITHATTLCNGVTLENPVSGSIEGAGIVSMNGLFVLSATAAVEIECYAVYASTGGAAMSSGEPEVWTDVVFTKVG